MLHGWFSSLNPEGVFADTNLTWLYTPEELTALNTITTLNNILI